MLGDDLTNTPVQAAYPKEPWRVCVVCILSNMTDREKVRQLLPELFEAFPHPRAMAAAFVRGYIKNLLEPLGLSNKKIDFLKRMSVAYYLEIGDVPPTRKQIMSLPRCGRYAADAVQIFCDGDIYVEPKDKALLEYVHDRRREVGDHVEDIVEERSK